MAVHARADVPLWAAAGRSDGGGDGGQRGHRLRDGQGHVQEGRQSDHPLQGQEQVTKLYSIIEYRVTTINVSRIWIEWAEWAALCCTAISPFPGHVYRRHPVLGHYLLVATIFPGGPVRCDLICST